MHVYVRAIQLKIDKTLCLYFSSTHVLCLSPFDWDLCHRHAKLVLQFTSVIYNKIVVAFDIIWLILFFQIFFKVFYLYSCFIYLSLYWSSYFRNIIFMDCFATYFLSGLCEAKLGGPPVTHTTWSSCPCESSPTSTLGMPMYLSLANATFVLDINLSSWNIPHGFQIPWYMRNAK